MGLEGIELASADAVDGVLATELEALKRLVERHEPARWGGKALQGHLLARIDAMRAQLAFRATGPGAATSGAGGEGALALAHRLLDYVRAQETRLHQELLEVSATLARTERELQDLRAARSADRGAAAAELELARRALCVRMEEASERAAAIQSTAEQLKDLRRRVAQGEKLLGSPTDQVAAARRDAATLAGMSRSIPFQLGYLLTRFARQPLRIASHAGAVLRLTREAVRRVRARRAGRVHPATDVVGVTLPAEWQASLATLQARAELGDRQVALAALATGHALRQPPAPASIADARIAIIADEFTRSDLAAHCSLLALERRRWREAINAFRPHFVLVESAWRGNDGAWTGHVETASAELQQMLEHCAANGIPTVFWNKEDPTHFEHFLRAAALFDHVATTDIDCIAAYRERLQHDRVFLLPFGVDPRRHHPVEAVPRREACSFAGSYYPQYPERTAALRTLCEVVGEHVPVEIYDRNAGGGEGEPFPPDLQQLVVGTLPYGAIELAYKGYRHAITLNSAPHSQSMVARRVFDLLASGTFVLSNHSRAMQLLFGDLVICGDEHDRLREQWQRLHGDPERAGKVRHLALRKVLDEHTVEHRIGTLLGQVFGRPYAVAEPLVTVAARVTTQAQFDAMQAAFRRQGYANCKLAIVAADGFRPAPGTVDPGTSLHSIASASAEPLVAALDPGYVACFSPLDYYGPDYLGDLVAGLKFAPEGAVGKAACRVLAEGALATAPGQTYSRVERLRLRRALVPLAALPHESLAQLARGIDTGSFSQGEAVALDAFSYCADACGTAVPAVDIGTGWLDTGLPLAAFQDAATHASRTGAEGGSAGDRLQDLFPRATHAHGKVSVGHDRGVSVVSTQGASDWTYVYAIESFRAAHVAHRGVFRFQLAARGRLSTRLVVIFDDEEHKRVGSVNAAFNAPQRINVPKECRWIRIALRVSGPGRLEMSKLSIGPARKVAPASIVLSQAPRLLVGKGYPSHSRLYHYSFIHRRVLAYRDHGLEHEVFRWSQDGLAFDAFEGIEIVSGGVEQLAGMLAGRHFESIEVHPLYPEMWAVLREHVKHTRINVWVHGAEIQPWYRRAFNYPPGPARDRAIKATATRTAMWRDIFRLRHPNLHLVFVSRYLARQAMADVGAELQPWQYSVIHNFIDGDCFRHEPKDPGQRNRILSIRPYNSPVYANDLAVKAVLELSREPWFGDLHFTFVGDGVLFDETLESLREMPNVDIRKGFLSQAEIASLHRSHGVFLVPTRMDSQGVSRDEAMSSGLVPVTNAIAAVPEFVDPGCGILAAPEDWRGLAHGIRELHADPDRFLAMSAASARCARDKSGFDHTIAREMALITKGIAPGDGATVPVVPRHATRFAVYGDLNLNITDGSAVWAASLVQVLAGLPDTEVVLFLKAPVAALHIIEPLLALDNVRLVEPPAEDGAGRTVAGALDAIAEHDAARPFDAIVLRGFDLCTAATAHESFKGRLWVYITDLPQNERDLDEEARRRIDAIIAHAGRVLCQTPQFEAHMVDCFPAVAGRTALLPPMIPEADHSRSEVHGDAPPRIVYAGKFAPLWGIREMLDVFSQLREARPELELHVYGDKIHQLADDPGFRPEIAERLPGTPGLAWHREVSRDQLFADLPGFDIGWAWRQPALEADTHELSTKVLEYAACGLPTVLYPNAVNRGLLGNDYPLFARSADEARDAVAAMLADRDALDALRHRLARVADRYTFGAVRDAHIRPLLDNVRTRAG